MPRQPNNPVQPAMRQASLWPDAQQAAQNLPPVPMLSRWNMTEHKSGSPGLLQVQYAFLELPKLPARRPEAGAAYWAWLFVHAPELSAMPADLPEGPFRDALELADKATFTQEELDAYQKVFDEIQQVRRRVPAARRRRAGTMRSFDTNVAVDAPRPARHRVSWRWCRRSAG